MYTYVLYVYTTLYNSFTCSRFKKIPFGQKWDTNVRNRGTHVTCFMSNNDLSKSEDEVSPLDI